MSWKPNKRGDNLKLPPLLNLNTQDEFMMEGKLSDIMDFVLKNSVEQPTIVISGKSIL